MNVSQDAQELGCRVSGNLLKHIHNLMALATLVAALAAFGCDGPDQGGSQSIESTAKGWVENDGVMLLDVRTSAEFAAGHIRGAVNIPVQELASRLGEVPEGRVVVYCHSGRRSATATEMLEAEGRNVLDIGAMTRWPGPADIVEEEVPVPPVG